jgi:hypothetical protein
LALFCGYGARQTCEEDHGDGNIEAASFYLENIDPAIWVFSESIFCYRDVQSLVSSMKFGANYIFTIYLSNIHVVDFQPNFKSSLQLAGPFEYVVKH